MLSKAEVSFMIIFLSLVCQVVTFKFLPSYETGVHFGEETGSIQKIDVDENNNNTKRVKVVIIDEATSQPTFEAYGDKDLLQIQINKAEDHADQYYMEVNSLDYEALTSKTQFTIQILVESEASQYLQLSIQNLDDEQPTLTTSTCIMKENTTITVEDTTCNFIVQDPDGFLDQIDFSNIISNGRDEDKLFELKYKYTPGAKDKEWPVYLVLQDGQILDYETLTSYSFCVNPRDGAGHPTIPESIPIVVQVEDIPDKPPVWTSFTSPKEIMEDREINEEAP